MLVEPKVIFEDDDILIVDKPAGMTVNRSDTTSSETTLQDWTERYLKIPNVKFQISNKFQIPNSIDQNNFEFRDSNFEFLHRGGIVHRLDKETSGILIVAKNPDSFEKLQKQFKERTVKKTYLALVHGVVVPSEGEINVPLGRLPWNRKQFGVVAGGREAMTRYRVIFNFQFSIFNETLSLLELYPQTGRTHQIRVHLKHIGHSIFADFLYSGRKTARNDRKLLSRLFLHASKIQFNHPKTGERVMFECKLPEELQSFLDSIA